MPIFECVCGMLRTSAHRYVDPKAVSKANAMFLRQLNFSGRDTQQVKMQVLTSYPAVVSSCFPQLCKLCHPQCFLLSSSCITMSCFSSQSEINQVNVHQSYLVWSRKKTWVHTSGIPKIVLRTVTQAQLCICIFQQCWCCAAWTLKCLK